MRILVAGIGNIFLGDDGFGSEVARALIERGAPEGVRVTDFGIRGFDLAYALEGCDAAILVDVVQRGGAPGTLYVIEPEADAAAVEPETHSMTPQRVLSFVPKEALPLCLRLVGCEPATFEPDTDAMGLSEPVQAAVAPALELIDGLLKELARA